MNLSMHVHNKDKDMLILGEGPTQELDDTILTGDTKYSINCTQSEKRFVLSLNYNGRSSFFFVNAIKIHPFRAKDSEEKCMHCLGNISKCFTNNIMKENKFKGKFKGMLRRKIEHFLKKCKCEK